MSRGQNDIGYDAGRVSWGQNDIRYDAGRISCKPDDMQTGKFFGRFVEYRREDERNG